MATAKKREPKKPVKAKRNIITDLHLKNFTAFDEIDFKFSDGVNILVGENSTGKTHVLKVLYAFCCLPPQNIWASKMKKEGEALNTHDVLGNLNAVFGCSSGMLLRTKSNNSKIEICNGQQNLNVEFGKVKEGINLIFPEVAELINWDNKRFDPVFIPAKEILTNAPGFRSLYESRYISFDATYIGIIDKAFLPEMREKFIEKNVEIAKTIENLMEGIVITENERFFLKSKTGTFEFSLVSDGYKKFALLWLLLKNGSLGKDTVLFWDEPEANVNPKAIKDLVGIILGLRELGVQVFLATHSYSILKEFDLQAKPEDGVMYHALYKKKKGKKETICVNSTKDFALIEPNAIQDSFSDIYNRDVQKALSPKKK